MPNSIWTGSYGRLKSYSVSFLAPSQLQALCRARDVKDFAQQLSATWYRADLEKYSAEFSPPELVEVACNSHLFDLNNIVLSSSPIYGRPSVLAYLSKWDIYNLELVLAAKAQGKTLKETQRFFVSSRDIPVSFGGSLISLAELRTLMSLPDVESVIKETVKYGYGSALLEKLGEYRETLDLGVLSAALYTRYYSNLQWQFRFMRGDEGPVRDYIRAQISKRNLFVALKGLDSRADRGRLGSHLIEGGFVQVNSVLDAYSTGSQSEVIRRFSTAFDSDQLVQRYEEKGNLVDLEVAVDQQIITKYARRMVNNSISAVSALAFILRAETERDNIRRALYGVVYAMSEQDISSMLLAW